MLILMNANHLCHHTTHLAWSIKLSLTLTAFRSKIFHQVFIGITQKVIITSTVAGKIKCIFCESRNKFRQSIYLVLTLTQFGIIIKIGSINHAAQIIFLCNLMDDFIQSFTDITLITKRKNILPKTSFRNIEKIILISLCLVTDIFKEEYNKYIILILAGIHATTQLITTLP